MRILQQILTDHFSKPRKQAKAPSVYIVEGHGRQFAMSQRRNGPRLLWHVEIDGRSYSNSKLGDLKAQLGDMGYIVRRPFDGLKRLIEN